MFAIVEADGRQYQLKAGSFIDLDLVKGNEGDPFVFDRVLMIVDGSESVAGTPFLEGARVNGRILSHGKNRKIIVYKQRPKKGTRKKQGHRQQITRVLIDSIEMKDKILAKADPAKSKTAEQKKAAKPTRTKTSSVSSKSDVKREHKPSKAKDESGSGKQRKPKEESRK